MSADYLYWKISKRPNVMLSIPPIHSPGIYKSLLKQALTIFSGRHRGNKNRFLHEDCVYTNSGRSSLFIILRTLNYLNPEKNEIIVPAYSCPSIPAAINKSKLKIVFCDIANKSFNCDEKYLKKLITGKTLAIVSQHLFGIKEDVSLIKEVANQNNVFLIEDCAQLYVSDFNKRDMSNTYGDFCFFSFGLGKSMTAGEGSVIYCRDTSMIKSLQFTLSEYPFPNFFHLIRVYLILMVYPIFLSKFFYGIIQLTKLNPENNIFKSDFKVKRYSMTLYRLLLLQLSNITKVKKQREIVAMRYRNSITNPSIFHFKKSKSYLRYPNLVLNKRVEISKNNHLGLSRMYRTCLTQNNKFNYKNRKDTFPNAEMLAKSLITLPVHDRVTKKRLLRIINFFNKV
jgi:perosamine synthetase